MNTNAQPAVAAGEPTAEDLRNPILRYFVATRPPFLTITLVGCVLGMASALSDGLSINVALALATMLLAITAHAAVNVHNDYCDHENGTDARNVARVFPYTGGSRFIQNGVMSPTAVRRYAGALFVFTIVGGLVLVARLGWGLLAIGASGVASGWAYSAPPLRLNSRGFGEICVAFTFGLVVVGADFVQRGEAAYTPVWAGLAYAFLTTNILYINQFPDRIADRDAGKLHWVARLPVAQSRWGYLLLMLLAVSGLILPVALGYLPRGAALGLVGMVPAAAAARTLMAQAGNPQALAPAIRQTIAAAHLVPLLTAVGLWWQP